MPLTYDVNIESFTPLISPAEFKDEMPATQEQIQLILDSRKIINDIINKEDKRMLMIVGPCSIHDEKAALEYAQKLSALKDKYKDTIYLVMRVYFEKPRTTIGWKGLISDPHINGSNDILTGLRKARKLLKEVLDLGLPTATEFLDPIVPQYMSGMVSWAAIGARTTESQTHREMASGLSMPVGFKNSTDGNMQVALDAMQSSRHAHSFLGIDKSGKSCIVRTKGNKGGHVILRGGRDKPNYDPETAKEVSAKLQAAGLPPGIMVDCSHANSGKKYEKQEKVWKAIIEQRVQGNHDLIGMMLESNLFEGNQPLPGDLKQLKPGDLKYGVSITDACVSIDTTERLLEFADEQLKKS